jgi:intracellular septation protein A
MGLDIRWPIGLMFSLIGAILVVYGFFTRSDKEMLQRSLGLNIDLTWGLLLLAFGLFMLLSAKIGARADKAKEK